jgi:hypothetical protein
MPGLRSWVRDIKRRARGGGVWAKNRQPSRGGSDFANDVRGGSDLGDVGLIWVG